MADCLTCKHNSYRDLPENEWVHCVHPITLRKGPHWEKGDPAMVDWRTGDVHVKDLRDMLRDGCSTHEPAEGR